MPLTPDFSAKMPYPSGVIPEQIHQPNWNKYKESFFVPKIDHYPTVDPTFTQSDSSYLNKRQEIQHQDISPPRTPQCESP